MLKEEQRIRAQKEARKAIDEETLNKVFRAVGANKIDKEATKTLKALAEEAIVEYAIRAQEIAKEREESTLNAECVACGVARSNVF